MIGVEIATQPPPAIRDRLRLSLEAWIATEGDIALTLGDLPMHAARVSRRTTGAEVSRLFAETPDLPGVIVHDERRTLGLLTRRRFLENLSKPLGRDVYLSRAILVMRDDIDPAALILDAADPIEDAAQRALERGTEQIYDPILVTLPTGGAAILDTPILMTALAEVHRIASRRNRELLKVSQENADQLQITLESLSRTQEQLVSDIQVRQETERQLRDNRARMMRQTTALQEIATLRAVRLADADAAVPDILRIIALTLQVDRVSLWAVRPQEDGGERLEQTAAVVPNPALLSASGPSVLPLAACPIYRQALTRDLSLIVPNVAADIRVAELQPLDLHPAGIVALMHVLVQAEQRDVGILRCEQADAPRAWTEDEVNFLKAAANFISLVTIGQARRQAEQAARESQSLSRLLLETSPVSVCLVDSEGQILFTNPNFNRLVGRSAAALRRARIDSLYADPAHHAADQARFARSGSLSGSETAILSADGLRWTLASWAGARFEGQDVTVLWLFEISDLKEIQARLQQAKDQAEAATQAKSAFLATMSHEIRTPMNGVLGMLDILAQTPLTAEQDHAVGLIRESAFALLRIIDDILDFSKIEAGRLDLEQVPVALADLAAGVTATLAPLAQKKGLVLRSRLDPTVPPCVLGDPVRLRQILFNLLGNAVKFTPSGEVALEVTPGPNGNLRVTVTDTGIGLSPDQIARLFQPFTQADPSTARRFGGSGLGLSICRLLVSLMGGEIGVDSTPGRGSRFWVHLPLPPATEPGVPVAPVALVSPGALPDLGGRGRVLVADDHPINREVILRQLQRLNCCAEAVENGEEALDRLTEGGFALLLTDCDMPVIDGYRLTRLLRAAEADDPAAPRLPIVGITANAQADAADLCRDSGMDDCLIKPVDTARLGACLAAWLPTPASPPGSPPFELVSLPSDIIAPPPPIAATAVDTRSFEALLDGDRAGIRGLLVRFSDSSAPLYADLDQALASVGPAEGVRQLAHKLKGAAGMVGAHGLADICLQIERAAQAEELDDAGRYRADLAAAWAAVATFISSYR